MKLGKEQKELEVEPVYWPQTGPARVPAEEPVPVEVPRE